MRFWRILVILAVCVVGAPAQRHPKKSIAGPLPPAPSAYTVEKIAVEGNRYYRPQQVIAASGLRVGAKAGPVEFEAARKKLEASGSFDNVSYRYAPSEDGEGYDVTLTVSEIGQLYPFRFEDLAVDAAEVDAWLKQKSPLFGDKIPASRPGIDQYVQWVSEYLAAHGHDEAITGSLTAEPGLDVAIVFRPAAERPHIAHVVFTNTGEVSAGTLQTAMYGVAIGLPYEERDFRMLLDSVARPLYEARGRVRVAFPQIEIARAKDVKGVVVTVRVEQGPVYTLDGVRFVGGNFSRRQMKELANLKLDTPVNFDDVKAAQGRIRDRLRRQGHLDASSIVKRDINDKDHTIDLTLQINPGPLYTLGKLDIVGLDLITEPEIRRMWVIEPGKPFDADYPDHFLASIKSQGVFDNLKTTRSATKINPDRTVDVTLYFNK